MGLLALWLQEWCILCINFPNNLLSRFEVGEVFISMTEPQAQEALEEAKATLEKDLATLKEGCDEAQKILTDLKVQLYAKFGDNINLEAE